MSGTFFSNVELILLTLFSIERWLHMSRRSLMTPRHRCLAVALLLIVPALFVVSNTVQYLRFGKLDVALAIINVVVILLCYFSTLFAYYKVYRIIRQHQQQVQGNQSSQNFGQPAINVAKYKRSVKCILYIFCSIFCHFNSSCRRDSFFAKQSRESFLPGSIFNVLRFSIDLLLISIS